MRSQNGRPSLNALPQGTVLHDYVIDSELGSGGFSIVYLARHRLNTDWLFAIKEYFPRELVARDRDNGNVRPVNTEAKGAFEDGLRRFRDEAEQLRRFRNERYIVSCLNYFEANGTAYLVMDYDDGLPLSEFLRRREAAGQPFTEADLRAVVEPLLEGLEVVHRAGVLHRDIKPANIFVRRPDDITGRPAQPVLIDFGAAKQNYLARHSHSQAPYTPGYAAYEQESSEGDIGPWTDIYSVGALMWRIVAGGCADDESLLKSDGADEISGSGAWDPTPPPAQSRAYALHLGRPNPMKSAAALGADRFSPQLLHTIDSCLSLYFGDRVQDCATLIGLLNTPAPPANTSSNQHDQSRKPKSPWMGLTKGLFNAVLRIPKITLSKILKLMSYSDGGLSLGFVALAGSVVAMWAYVLADYSGSSTIENWMFFMALSCGLSIAALRFAWFELEARITACALSTLVGLPMVLATSPFSNYVWIEEVFRRFGLPYFYVVLAFLLWALWLVNDRDPFL